MNREYFDRTRLLFGEDGMDKIYNSHVAVFGIGGVGGHATEALVRSGIGYIDIFDNDVVSITNINRQLIATSANIGRSKVEVMKERLLEINPDVKVNIHKVFYLPENADKYDLSQYDYIVDAIDTVTAKIELIVRADRAAVPIISSMGAGNKLDPTQFEVTDIYKTMVCPLAKVMRRELNKRGIEKLKVVYSKEIPIQPIKSNELTGKRQIPGSVSFVPSVVGLIMAGEIVKDISTS